MQTGIYPALNETRAMHGKKKTSHRERELAELALRGSYGLRRK